MNERYAAPNDGGNDDGGMTAGGRDVACARLGAR
jgi:hypothetical protein